MTTDYQQRGNALLEFVLIIPALLLLISIAVDLSIVLKEHGLMKEAAYVAGRSGAVQAPGTPSTVISATSALVANTYLQLALQNPTNYTVVVTPAPVTLASGGTVQAIRVAISRLPAGRFLILPSLSRGSCVATEALLQDGNSAAVEPPGATPPC